jgi:hypothetical protein
MCHKYGRPLVHLGPLRPSKLELRSVKAGSRLRNALWAPPCASILGYACSAARAQTPPPGLSAGWRASHRLQPYTHASMGPKFTNRELRNPPPGPTFAH